MDLICPWSSGVYRGSYISAHVLFDLLNKLGKRNNMQGLSSILSLFHNSFNKLNNTRAQNLGLDSIYHDIKIIRILISAVKHYNFVNVFATLWTS